MIKKKLRTQILQTIIVRRSKDMLYTITVMENESRAIYEILQKLGVTTEFALWCRRNAAVINACENLKYQLFDLGLESHIIGSFADGSYREGFNSDIDLLNIYNRNPVIENANSTQRGRFHLSFTNDNTPPGYVYLEVCETPTAEEGDAFDDVKRDTIQQFLLHKYDSFDLRETGDGRIVKTNKRATQGTYRVSSHGPAEAHASLSLSNQEEENIYAYRCGDWPTVAERWFQRCNAYLWPSMEDLERMKQLPLHVVPVGHPHSKGKEKELQWRYSFTLHERYLISKLNETQLKCYFLLKQIKQDLIKPETKDLTQDIDGKSLTSYHCKTSLLYAIQKSNPDMWKPENLIGCVLYCLNLIIKWLKEGYIPDFFIPENNLMDGKIEGRILISKIKELLQGVLSDPIASLHRLKHIGKLFSCSPTSGQPELSELYATFESEQLSRLLLYMTKTAVAGFDLCGCCLYYITENSKVTKDAISNHLYIIDCFHRFMKTQEGEIQNVLQQGLAYLHTSLGCHLVLQAKRYDLYVRDWIVAAAAMNFAAGSSHNVASYKLKLTNVLLMSGHLESAKHVLDDFERNVDRSTLCINFGITAPVSDLEREFSISCLRGMGLNNIINFPCSLLLQKLLSAPVVFLPTELDMTPDALKLEMFRSMATPPDSVVPHFQYWYRWASVDITVMWPFLKYLTSQNKDFPSFMDELSRVTSLYIAETPQNILGWAAMTEGYTSLAARCFAESWAICSRRTEKLTDVFKIDKELLRQHNAAKLWMLVLMIRCSDTKIRESVGEERATVTET